MLEWITSGQKSKSKYLDCLVRAEGRCLRGGQLRHSRVLDEGLAGIFQHGRLEDQEPDRSSKEG